MSAIRSILSDSKYIFPAFPTRAISVDDLVDDLVLRIKILVQGPMYTRSIPIEREITFKATCVTDIKLNKEDVLRVNIDLKAASIWVDLLRKDEKTTRWTFSIEKTESTPDVFRLFSTLNYPNPSEPVNLKSSEPDDMSTDFQFYETPYNFYLGSRLSGELSSDEELTGFFE